MNIYLWIPDKTGSGADNLFINGEKIDSNKYLTKEFYDVYNNISESAKIVYQNKNNKISKLRNDYLISFYSIEKDNLDRIIPIILIIKNYHYQKSDIYISQIENIFKEFPLDYSKSDLNEISTFICSDNKKHFYKSFHFLITITIIIVILTLIILIINNYGK